jgi:hypothetical protein
VYDRRLACQAPSVATKSVTQRTGIFPRKF